MAEVAPAGVAKGNPIHSDEFEVAGLMDKTVRTLLREMSKRAPSRLPINLVDFRPDAIEASRCAMPARIGVAPG